MTRLGVILILACLKSVFADDGFCAADKPAECEFSGSSLTRKYLFYDVNPPEGFNLRRDVYMRVAIFMHEFHKSHPEWQLVLPPWPRLYHWKSSEIGSQSQLPWSLFFDLESLTRFAPVIEMHQVFREIKLSVLDQVLILQHYADAFTDGWEWNDKWSLEPCLEHKEYYYHYQFDSKLKSYTGWFWHYDNITARDVKCISYQGPNSLLADVLDKMSAQSKTVMLDRAEVVLHGFYGDQTYWKCRRSMRFASHLVEEATYFRRTVLNSSDESDGTFLPQDWRDEVGKRTALGGPYLAVHLRRQDFVMGRPDVPDLQSATAQISNVLRTLNLNAVFIATDAPPEEIIQIKSLLKPYLVLNYDKTKEKRKLFKDGGIAIIDQIICSHARYFIGTHESTFSFRIQEEREILGFLPETTFNRLCKTAEKTCEQPTQWKILY